MKASPIYQEVLKALETLQAQTAHRSRASFHSPKRRPHRLQKVLVANRGEIAKRFFLALHEEGIPSVAIVTEVDRGQSWYEFADEVVLIGDEGNYSDIPTVLAAALLAGANAIYAGYGFLSENATFVGAIGETSAATGQELVFMGPSQEVMRTMGDKVSARAVARRHAIPMFEGSRPFDDDDPAEVSREATRIGYPVIVKLSAGGGGKGMQVVHKEGELSGAIASCRRIGSSLYGDSRFYLERFIVRPVHIEVQVFNGRAVGIRKCAVQRRNQKIIEENGYAFLDDHLALSFLSSAERIAVVSGYDGCGAGTVEFLIDSADGTYGFMEMNTRLQVEYGVTDQSLGIDLVKWQILHFDGRGSAIRGLDTIKFKMAEREHAIECRIYAEDPACDYRPSPGTITGRELPTFNGVRCDFGFGAGDRILPMYDPMIGKIIAHGASRDEALIRLERALQEFHLTGVKTNIAQLLAIVRHPEFIRGTYTNNLLREYPVLEGAGQEAQDAPQAFELPTVLGAFAAYLARKNRAAEEFCIVAANQGIALGPHDNPVPHRFFVTSPGGTCRDVAFVQVELDSFYALLDGSCFGRLKLRSCNPEADDLVVAIDHQAERIRIDRHLDVMVLRMRDQNKKINYYRMQVEADGLVQKKEQGKILSPFQGSFVAFAREGLKVGDLVKKGDPLVILSAMKMETVLESPCDGEVAYIIEDGKLQALQLAKTSDGRIIGKSLKEGELLIRVAPAEIPGEDENRAVPSAAARPRELRHTLDFLLDAHYEQELGANLQQHFDHLLEIFAGMVRGYVDEEEIRTRLIKLLTKLTPEGWRTLFTVSRTDVVNRSILHYTYIKRLFSPTVSSEGFAHPEELAELIGQQTGAREAQLSQEFRALIADLTESYGLDGLQAENDAERMRCLHFYHALKSSYDFCTNYWPLIGHNIGITGSLHPSSGLTLITLRRLLKHTLRQLDDSSSQFVKGVIAKQFPQTSLDIYADIADEQGEAGTPPIFDAKYEKELQTALTSGGVSGATGARQVAPWTGAKPWMKEHLAGRLAALPADTRLTLLPSPLDGCQLYLAQSAGEKVLTTCYAFVYLDSLSCAMALQKGRRQVLYTAHALRAMQTLQSASVRRLEIILHGSTLTLDDDSPCDGAKVRYDDIRQLCLPALRYFHTQTIGYGVLELIAAGTPAGESGSWLRFFPKEESLALELLPPHDAPSPYPKRGQVDAETQRLFDMGKWPIELWAQLCLDPASGEEITIDRIDRNAGGERVGAKIIKGTMRGAPCLFYLKDFRVIGGATGNLEGLKYGAATYLSYIKGWPLYVWNDSAGANIRQGVIALNRGGQGFMMNTLLAGNCDPDKFTRYTRHSYDPELTAVFDEVARRFGDITDSSRVPKPKDSLIVAVGIGASAGLDVYGSSQATLQIVLDAQTSYRVLTGANVIKSVLGENISNYDIGGAKILGKWTGTVDLVACDKLELIRKVRRIHGMFAARPSTSSVARTKAGGASKGAGEDPTLRHHAFVMDEELIRGNVDHGEFIALKGDYYAANALLGGFARLGGKRVMILGPRTGSGITSTPAVIKAHELLRIAARTQTPQILVFGAALLRPTQEASRSWLQPQIDFMASLTTKGALRVHIITQLQGLECAYANAHADVIIFVQKEELAAADAKFAQMNATFIVSSMREAFDLAHNVVHLIATAGETEALGAPQGIPAIPQSKGQPYNMIESVILPTFDADSFLEFYGAMNRPSGPFLITGLAKFHGRTVGIIADQPQIKGGGADAPGAEKFRIFTDFLNRMKLPIVMLSNSSGFVPGSQQERLRIQAIGADSLNANISGETPVVSVVLGQVYGGRQIQAFSKTLRPGIVYLALRDALIAVMGETAAFDLLGAKTYQKFLGEGQTDAAADYRKNFVTRFMDKAQAANDASQTGVVDWTIDDIGELRTHIARGFDLATQRCILAFGPPQDGAGASL